MRKQFVVEDDDNFDEVNFTLEATSGTYFISPTHNPNPINIYGKISTESYNPEFRNHLQNRVNYVNLNLQENGKADLDHTLNSIDLQQEESIAYSPADDQYRQDLFYRYNQNFQDFFDASARVETSFD